MEQNKFDPLQFIGILLISAILMFWFYDNQSSMIENQQMSEAENLVEETTENLINDDNLSSNNLKIDQRFEEEIISLENENILFEISTGGGEINKILLKNFSNYNESGPPLGIMAKTKYTEHTIPFDNSSMYIFTDGITEIKNPKGEMLGSEGFQNYIQKYKDKPNNERLKIIIDDILNTGHVQKDDLTIVVIDSKN